jgi:hypothetical protein
MSFLFEGEQLSLKVLREGKELSLTITLLPSVELVPLSKFDVMPTYYIYCGLVFQPLSLDYIYATFGYVHFFLYISRNIVIFFSNEE